MKLMSTNLRKREDNNILINFFGSRDSEWLKTNRYQ